MHPSLNMNDILNLFACELVESELKATAVSLARCCRSFKGPVLDVLWETQDQLIPLLKCLPQDVWRKNSRHFTFLRIPTKAEWNDFKKYARRMRKLEVDAHEDPISSETLLTLQCRTVNKPLLPRLKSFECYNATVVFIPFMPLFLSPQTTTVNIGFGEVPPLLMVASPICIISTLCSNLERVTIYVPDRHPIIADAISEMLLACDPESLQSFAVDSSLTDEAREVVFRLPNLSRLMVAIEDGELLPPIALPNLTDLDIEYFDHFDWLQGFHGAVLNKLEAVTFRSTSDQTGNFLGAFESVALTISLQNTLSEFRFYTSRRWIPDYSSLLSFKQLRKLEIEFSCYDGCSSRVNDDIIATLAQTMPKLEILKLGSAPCNTSTGATVLGLITLASCCPRLSKLRIHFQADTLVDAARNAATTPPFIARENCVLTHLEVGSIPIQGRRQSAIRVALILLQIFPYILHVNFINPEWRMVEEHIEDVRRINAFVRRAGEVRPVVFNNS